MYRPLPILLIVFTTLTSGCRSYQVPPDPLTLEAIVQMSEEGKAPEEIIGEIRASRTIYDLRTSDVLWLVESGVDAAVTDHILETHRRAVEAYYRYPYGPYWYGPYPYPYPAPWYYCW